MSTLDSISSAGQIIGLVIGIISAIATIACCIVLICSYCKNKSRNNVWAESQPPSYYYQNQSYGRTTNTPYYYQQEPPPAYTTNTYQGKY